MRELSDSDNVSDGPLELGEDVVTRDEFLEAFDKTFDEAINVDVWETDETAVAGRLEREIEHAQSVHNELRSTIRDVIVPRLSESPFRPPDVGIFSVKPEEIEQFLRGILFAGHVEAVDGTSKMLDMLPLSIVQLGICSTSYSGQRNEWSSRMFRQDLRRRGNSTVEDAIRLLEARRNRAGYERSSRSDKFSDLTRRGIMTYAERAVLVRKCTTAWRMGHGNPLAYELLMGSGMPALIAPGVAVMRELILGHQKFVFVPSSADRMYETIALSLNPGQYILIETMEPYLDKVLKGHFGETGAWAQAKEEHLDSFYDDVKEQVVVGAYRVSEAGRPHIFYAHRDHAHVAARIAMADGALQEHRGFPMLIDLAHNLCSSLFAGNVLASQTQTAFVDVGATLDYATERMTR